MEISEGEGWRLVIAPDRRPYGVLIGGDHWAMELRSHEFQALGRAVATLVEQYRQLQPTLMAEEAIDLELDLELPVGAEPMIPTSGSDPPAAGALHVALHGDGQSWALHFVLTPGDGARAGEGGWSAAASLPLATALTRLSGGG